MWFYDSSQQLLVFADVERREYVGFRAVNLMRAGWGVHGLDKLPRWDEAARARFATMVAEHARALMKSGAP
jgi:hypothetical protein